MKRQRNQYSMYGISVSYDTYKDWNLNSNDDISCVFDTRDGKYMIIGKVLESTNVNNPLLPLIEPKLEKIDELIIQNSVEEQFGVSGKFHYYFVTHVR